MKCGLAILVFFVLSPQLGFAQDAGLRAGGDVSRPPDEAVIDETIPTFRVTRFSLADLQKFDAPAVIFIFGADRKPLIGLSRGSKKIIDRHWIEALRYFWNDEFRKPRSAQENHDRSLEWMRICNRTVNELQKAHISAPNGKRQVSFTEASRTMGFLNRVALALVQRVKAAKPNAVALHRGAGVDKAPTALEIRRIPFRSSKGAT